MSTKLAILFRQERLEAGAKVYFSEPRDIAENDANVALIGQEIERQAAEKKIAPNLADQSLWHEAVKSLGSRLVPWSEEPKPVESEPERQPWKYPFPEFHTVAEARRLPSAIFNSFYYDKDRHTGKPSKKSQQFRDYLQSLIDKENAAKEDR